MTLGNLNCELQPAKHWKLEGENDAHDMQRQRDMEETSIKGVAKANGKRSGLRVSRFQVERPSRFLSYSYSSGHYSTSESAFGKYSLRPEQLGAFNFIARARYRNRNLKYASRSPA